MFKRAATKLQSLLEAERAGIKVSVNPERPGKGNFTVTVGGKQVISLLSMPRPFTKLRSLDLEDAASTVLKACA